MRKHDDYVIKGRPSITSRPVAFSRTQYVGADCILIANDSVPGDELRKTTIKLAKPPSVKLVIKNINDSIEAIKSGVTDKYNLFIVVESVNDARRIASAIDEIKSINLGGIKAKEGSKNISKAINLLPTEIEQLQQLVGKGVEVEIRRVPNDRKQLLRNACNSGGQIMVEALLLGLVAFIAQSEYALGTSLISRPIVTGLLTGLVLGMYRPASLWARRWSWRLSALSPLAPRSRPTW